MQNICQNLAVNALAVNVLAVNVLAVNILAVNRLLTLYTAMVEINFAFVQGSKVTLTFLFEACDVSLCLGVLASWTLLVESY